MTTDQAIQVVNKCIKAEMARGKTMKQAVEAVEKVAKQLAADNTEPDVGIHILKMIFLNESPTTFANSYIKTLLK